MQFKYRNTGIIKEGKRIYDDPSLHSRLLRTMEGQRFEEMIRVERKPASKEQMAFYVGVVLKEAHRHEQFNHYESPKKLHDQLFAPIFLNHYDAAGKEKVKKLSELSEQEMWDLTERVIAYLSSEHDIEISDQKNYYIK